jgi:hypothetical protein
MFMRVSGSSDQPSSKQTPDVTPSLWVMKMMACMPAGMVSIAPGVMVRCDICDLRR